MRAPYRGKYCRVCWWGELCAVGLDDDTRLSPTLKTEKYWLSREADANSFKAWDYRLDALSMRSADIKFGTSDWSARERTPLCIFRITETSDWSGGTQPPFRPAESLGDVSGRTKLSSSLGEGVWQEDLQEMIGSAGRAATRVGGTVFSKAWIGGRLGPPPLFLLAFAKCKITFSFASP